VKPSMVKPGAPRAVVFNAGVEGNINTKQHKERPQGTGRVESKKSRKNNFYPFLNVQFSSSCSQSFSEENQAMKALKSFHSKPLKPL